MNREFRVMPEQASSFAGDVDRLYLFLVVISGAITLVIAALIVYFAIKYRRGSTADRSTGHGHFLAMEISWIVGPFLLSMVIFVWGARQFFHQMRPPAGAMEIDCVGKQWMWKFQHPEGNAEINDLHVPIGQPVRLNMISEDVIHSVYIPAFRVKQDVLPGRYTTLWFRPTKPGRYHLFCAEYCGAKHSEMKGTVHALEPAEYQAWLSGATTLPTSVSGRELFAQLRCNTCHDSAGGAPARGPPLQGVFGSEVKLADGRTVTADETYLRESILRPAAKVVQGYQPIMPSYEGQLDEAALLKLIAEIKSMSKPKNETPESAKKASD